MSIMKKIEIEVPENKVEIVTTFVEEQGFKAFYLEQDNEDDQLLDPQDDAELIAELEESDREMEENPDGFVTHQDLMAELREKIAKGEAFE